jgi:hypothetical protein
MTEFEVSAVLYGGIIFALVLITGFFFFLNRRTGNKITKQTIVKELFNEKERSNGQHKGGARGKWS